MHTKVLSWIFVGLLCFEIVFNSVNAIRQRERERHPGSPCRCGRNLFGIFAVPRVDSTYTRVINGNLVNPVYKYPWMVSVGNENKHLCGGTIIGPNKVLTAAHCLIRAKSSLPPDSSPCLMSDDGLEFCPIKVSDLSVRFIGQNGLSRPMSVKDAIYNRKYTNVGQPHDIAILSTHEKFPCNQYTAPICLPESSDWYKPGTKVTIAGWGQTIPGLQTRDVGQRYTEANVEIKELSYHGTSNTCLFGRSNDHFCVLGNRQNSCYGDSGGPAFAQRNGVFYIVGISSWGSSANCTLYSHEYYTKVFKFLPWICKNINPRFSQDEMSWGSLQFGENSKNHASCSEFILKTWQN